MPTASPNFDLHCHPTTKTIMAELGQNHARNCWEHVNVGVADQLMQNSLNSQASLTQLFNGHVNLAVVALYGVEFAFANSTVLEVLNCLTEVIHDEYFAEIRKADGMGYLGSIIQELRHLRLSANGPGGKKMKIINRIEDYVRDDPNTIHLILSLEGSHNLDPVGDGGDNPPEADLIETITFNFRKFFKNPRDPQFEGRLLHLTLTHLANNQYANHCWGMPKLLGGRLGSDSFTPKNDGLSRIGRAQIREALRDRDEAGNSLHRVLIDIKHMSLKARQQFYALLETPDFVAMRKNGRPIPIVASHTGVTGLPVSHIYAASLRQTGNEDKGNQVTYHRVPGRLRDSAFNPWTINLFDEDIRTILRSGGLIGLSLDQRILGVEGTEPERFSVFEPLPPFQVSNGQPQGGFDANHAGQDESDWDLSGENRQNFEHLRHFCNNLLHIALTAQESGLSDEVAWGHVCIGSDFDGLINAMDYATSAADLGILRQGVNTWLRKFAANLDYQRDAAFWDGVTEKLFFQNAFEFLQTHFSGVDEGGNV